MYHLIKDFTTVHLPLFLILADDGVAVLVSAISRLADNEYIVKYRNGLIRVKCNPKDKMYYAVGICRSRLVYCVSYNQKVGNTNPKKCIEKKRFGKKIIPSKITTVQTTFDPYAVPKEKSNPSILIDLINNIKVTHQTHIDLTPSLVPKFDLKLLLIVLVAMVGFIAAILYFGQTVETDENVLTDIFGIGQ